MKKLLFTLFIFSSLVSVAQPVRLHLMGGFANYNGDIQQKAFTLQQAKAAISAGATFNVTEKFALRMDYSFAHVGAADKYNNKSSLVARNLSFQTFIQELALLGEYDILNLNTHKISPYVFAGLGVFHYSPYTYDSKGRKTYLLPLNTEGEGFIPGKNKYKTTLINLPVGAGIKYALSDDIHVGFEMGLRVLNTDYLDDVSGTYVDQNALLAARGPKAVELAYRGDELKNSTATYPAAGSQRGNSNVKDFYYFGLFRIDFRMNWFDNGSGRDKGLRCPVKL